MTKIVEIKNVLVTLLLPANTVFFNDFGYHHYIFVF